MILFFCLLVCPSAPANVESFYRLSVHPSDRVSFCMFIRLFARLRGCPPMMLPVSPSSPRVDRKTLGSISLTLSLLFF